MKVFKSPKCDQGELEATGDWGCDGRSSERSTFEIRPDISHSVLSKSNPSHLPTMDSSSDDESISESFETPPTSPSLASRGSNRGGSGAAASAASGPRDQEDDDLDVDAPPTLAHPPPTESLEALRPSQSSSPSSVSEDDSRVGGGSGRRRSSTKRSSPGRTNGGAVPAPAPSAARSLEELLFPPSPPGASRVSRVSDSPESERVDLTRFRRVVDSESEDSVEDEAEEGSDDDEEHLLRHEHDSVEESESDSEGDGESLASYDGRPATDFEDEGASEDLEDDASEEDDKKDSISPPEPVFPPVPPPRTSFPRTSLPRAPEPTRQPTLEELLFPPTPPTQKVVNDFQSPQKEDEEKFEEEWEPDFEPPAPVASSSTAAAYLVDSDDSSGSELPTPPRPTSQPSQPSTSSYNVISDSDSDLEPLPTPPRKQYPTAIDKKQTVLVDLTNSPDRNGFHLPVTPGAKVKKVLRVDTKNLDGAGGLASPHVTSQGEGSAHPALALLTSDPATANLPDVPQPFDLKVTLMPHQRIGLRWLVAQEKAANRRGGILADDMGLGKTVQTIALMLANKPASSFPLSTKERKTTLIVATKALAPQWEREIKSKTRSGALSVLLYHGANRPRDPRRLERYDVVITTFSTLEAERRTRGSSSESEGDSDSPRIKSKQKQELGTLFATRWLRIVLDEAHIIKNRSTKAAVAACRLDAQFRFCLTGTPCQNSLEDIHSLLKFLRIAPYNDFKLFKTDVLEPYKRNKNGSAEPALERLKAVLASVMLRRTKTSVDTAGKPLLDLPPKQVDLEKCQLRGEEKAAYDKLEAKLKNDFDSMVAAEERKYATALTYILRLRQCCDHPALVGALEDEEEMIDEELLGGGAIGKDGMEGLEGRMAGLSVAPKSMGQVKTGSKDWNTAKQRKAKNEEMVHKLERRWISSAKTDKAMDVIREALDEDPRNKICVFSQFTRMLDVLEIPLRKQGLQFVRYDGTMSIPQREQVLASFRNTGSLRIMLISLKCGSLGLNLVCANRVLLVDPWWNGTIEDQAVDRVHRIGQTREVKVSRLIVEGTIEERIVEVGFRRCLLKERDMD